MPRVRPRTSRAPLTVLRHTPARASAAFSGTRRISMMISPITSSATERVLEYGALNTGMPRRFAACTSTWLVPMQKQPMQNSRSAAASTSAESRVRERMPTTWASRISASRSSASGAAAWHSTVL